MPNCSLGIDHPVVTVRDFNQVREQYRSLGFSPNPVGYHPWGTVMSLMMFKDNFIELISVDDSSKFGTNSVHGFCYGRNVGKFLERVEGLGLVALHSKDSRSDHARLTSRGLESQGLIDFKRNTKKADGTPDTAVVSLGLFLNEEHRDVSHFICHQHKPELIWVPEWMNHANGVNAITTVTYLAERPSELLPRFVGMYGEVRVQLNANSLAADTGCGVFRVVDRSTAIACFGSTLPDWDDEKQPHGIAITMSTPLFSQLEDLWRKSGIPSQRTSRGTLAVPPKYCGNVILEFEPVP